MLRKITRQLIKISVASAIMIIALAFVSMAQNGQAQDGKSQDGFYRNELEVHFMDVGQADAILIKCEGHNTLIDGGNAADSSKIYAYLKNQGVTSLDYIINTHGDEDHVGGIPGAIQLVGSNIGTVFAPYTDLDKDRFRKFTESLGRVGKTITVPREGDTYPFGNAQFQILSAGGTDGNSSIVLRLKYGDNSFLFTGDAGEDQEKRIIDKGYEIESDVLKVGHHGSNTSTCYRFLREVYPKAAVICVGKDNTYGHPTEEVLSRLRDEGAEVFRTDNNGDIVFYSDGRNIEVSVQKMYDRDTNMKPRN